jgi:hypothetical protein
MQLHARVLPWTTLHGLDAAGVHASACCCDAADAVFQRLEAGAAVPDQHLYSRDVRGVWMRRAGHNRTTAYSKYCTTCNIWYVHAQCSRLLVWQYLLPSPLQLVFHGMLELCQPSPAASAALSYVYAHSPGMGSVACSRAGTSTICSRQTYTTDLPRLLQMAVLHGFGAQA